MLPRMHELILLRECCHECTNWFCHKCTHRCQMPLAESLGTVIVFKWNYCKKGFTANWFCQEYTKNFVTNECCHECTNWFCHECTNKSQMPLAKSLGTVIVLKWNFRKRHFCHECTNECLVPLTEKFSNEIIARRVLPRIDFITNARMNVTKNARMNSIKTYSQRN